MKRHTSLMVILCFFLICSACSATEDIYLTGIEANSYEQKVLKVDNKAGLDMNIENGNIEVFTWDKNEIKFEIKKQINGNTDRSVLQEMLNNLTIDIAQNDDIISLNSKYKGKKDINYSKIDLIIYLPKKINSISCNIGGGWIKFIDDIRCDLKIKSQKAFIQINNIVGKIDAVIGEGNFTINNGTIHGDTKVQVEKGNISIRAGLDPNGFFDFSTMFGNIDLSFPEDVQTSFISTAAFKVNEFGESSYPARVKAYSKIGRVSILKINKL